MSRAELTIDLAAITANWQALDRLSAARVETAAVVKADAYGLGAGPVSHALSEAGVRRFFVALAEEGAAVRAAVGPQAWIGIFSGHMAGDADLIAAHDLVPMLNAPEQFMRHMKTLAGHPFGLQLDSGMNRLGFEPGQWETIRGAALEAGPDLLMSHLACADEPAHTMNQKQLKSFKEMTDGLDVPRSLAATGGILLGEAYHFDVTRPGIGLYGGAPFMQARPAVRLSLPVIQTRELAPGETVGYGNAWVAERPTCLATVGAGYADGLLRAMSGRGTLWAGETPCPLVGRVSMDLITVDITHLSGIPATLDILGPRQGVDDLAGMAGTIGYEILTGLGPRYARRHGAVA